MSSRPLPYLWPLPDWIWAQKLSSRKSWPPSSLSNDLSFLSAFPHVGLLRAVSQFAIPASRWIIYCVVVFLRLGGPARAASSAGICEEERTFQCISNNDDALRLSQRDLDLWPLTLDKGQVNPLNPREKSVTSREVENRRMSEFGKFPFLRSLTCLICDMY